MVVIVRINFCLRCGLKNLELEGIYVRTLRIIRDCFNLLPWTFDPVLFDTYDLSNKPEVVGY